MKGEKFLILGNDKKMISCCNKLRRMGYTAEMYDNCKDFDRFNNIVLPLPTIANRKIKGTDMTFDEFKQKLDCEQKVFCGNINVTSVENYYSYYYDEAFLINNSRLTAQGVLRLILDSIDCDLLELNAVVIGYGRCGKAISRLLKNCGINVVSASRRNKTLLEAHEDGIKAVLINQIDELVDSTDIVINTVPVNIIKREYISRLDSNDIYIEVASKPYGFDITETDVYNFRYILAESLPGRFVPESAGENIADTVLKILKEEVYG